MPVSDMPTLSQDEIEMLDNLDTVQHLFNLGLVTIKGYPVNAKPQVRITARGKIVLDTYHGRVLDLKPNA